MSSLIVLGAQWGDEGKGKIVDLWGSDPVHAQAFSVWVSSPSGYSGNP